MRYFLSHRGIIILVVVIIAIFIGVGNSYFDNGIILHAQNIAQTKASIALEEGIRESILNNLDDNIIDYKTNDDGAISYIGMDAYTANKIMADTLSYLKNTVPYTKFDDLYLPIGYIFTNNIFFSNGPKIKIRLEPLGTYKTNIVNNVINVGINNSLLEIFLEITINYKILIPMQSTEFEFISKIPLSKVMVNGDIPKFYYHN